MTHRHLLAGAALFVACNLAADATAAQRTFVASSGVDSGTCTLVAPCRSFAFALTQTDAGGEVVALDAAGYGAVAIDKSVTITSNPGFFAGIAAATGSAVSVTTPGITVILRGLALNGIGAAIGIDMPVAARLIVENCIVSGFGTHGIAVAGNSNVSIDDSIVRFNGMSANGDGIHFASGVRAALNNVTTSSNARAGVTAQVTGEQTHVSVFGGEASANAIGYQALQEGMSYALVVVHGGAVKGNGIGLFAQGSAGAVGVSSTHVTGNGVAYQTADTAIVGTSFNNYVNQNVVTLMGNVIPVPLL